MGCGCSSNSAWAGEAEPVSDPMAFHVIVPTNGVRRLDTTALCAMVAAYPQSLFTIVDTSTDAKLRFLRPPGGRYLHVGLPQQEGASFSWPDAVNAAILRRYPYTVVLHDDVELPEGTGWLAAFSDALQCRKVGMVVPLVSGDCRCAAQSPDLAWCDAPFWPVYEPVSGCCFATRTSLIVGGFAEELYGYEWHQVDHQYTIANVGMATVCVPVTVKHAVGSIWGPGPETDAATLHNLDQLCSRQGTRKEFDARPSMVRSWPADMARDGHACCAVVDSLDGAVAASKIVTDTDNGVYLVDGSRTGDVYRYWSGPVVGDTSAPRYYQPSWDDDPIVQAISMPATDNLVVFDLRDGSQVPPRSWQGQRIRIGAGYDFLERLRELHVGMTSHYGMCACLIR